MNATLTLLATLLLGLPTFGEVISQAKWCHQLFSNRLVGDKVNELWIYSGIYTGSLGYNASEKFGQKVKVHGWVYGLKDGLLKDLGVTMERSDHVLTVFADAVKRYPRKGPKSEIPAP